MATRKQSQSTKNGTWTSSQWYSNQRVAEAPRYWAPNDDGLITHLAYITDKEIALLHEQAEKDGDVLIARKGPAGVPFFTLPTVPIAHKNVEGEVATDLPIGWKSSPDHPMARLVYVTDEQAEFLKKMDIHNSGVDEHDHYGPDNVPSYQGDGGGGGDGGGDGGGGDGGGGGNGGDGGGGGNGGDSSSSSDSSTTSDTSPGYADPGYSQGITDPGYTAPDTAPDTAPSTTTDTPSIDTSPDSLDTGLASESFSSPAPDTGVSDAAPSGSRSFSPSTTPAALAQDDTEFGDLAAAIAAQTPSTTSLSPAQTQAALEAAAAQAPSATSLSPGQTQSALDAAAAAATAAQTGGRGGTAGMVATNGMSYADLAALSQAGFGKMDISPTQTVDQAMAAMTAHSALNSNLPGIMTAITGNPAFGQAISIAQGIQGLMSGQLSIGQATVNTAISAAAQALGVPPGLVTGVVNGNPGQAVSSATTGLIGQAVSSALSQLTGISPATISATLGVTGVTPAVGQAISGAVNNALGVTPSGQTNTAAVGQAITDAVSGITDAVSGAFSGTGTGSTTTTGGLSTISDSGGGGGDAVTSTPTTATAPSTTSSPLSALSSGAPSGGGANTSTRGALPITPEASMLQAGPVGNTVSAADIMAKLPQLSQQLTGVDPRLLQVLTSRQSSPSYYSYGQSDVGPASFMSPGSGGLPSPKFPLSSSRDTSDPFDNRAAAGSPSALTSAGMGLLSGSPLRGFAQGGDVEGHNPQFITGKTGYYVQGAGDGQSDSIPAMLADGEYVFDADTVAALGNGSNKAGALLLDKMRENIRKHKRSAKPGEIPPPAKSPLAYMKG